LQLAEEEKFTVSFSTEGISIFSDGENDSDSNESDCESLKQNNLTERTAREEIK
jgi:hypothetical protein